MIGDEGARIIARDALLPHHGSRGRVVRVSVDRRQRRRGLGRTAVDDLVRRARHREMSEGAGHDGHAVVLRRGLVPGRAASPSSLATTSERISPCRSDRTTSARRGCRDPIHPRVGGLAAWAASSSMTLSTRGRCTITLSVAPGCASWLTTASRTEPLGSSRRRRGGGGGAEGGEDQLEHAVPANKESTHLKAVATCGSRSVTTLPVTAPSPPIEPRSPRSRLVLSG